MIIKKYFLNGLTLIISFALCVIFIELFFRFFIPENISFIHFDEELGWIHKKNKKGYWRQENSKPSYVTTNSIGLRSPEISKSKSKNKMRILILGDSFTQGLSVDDTLTFCQLLERNINSRIETEVEIINAGVGGYSPIQHYLMLNKIQNIYYPDIIIQAFFTENDIIDNADPAGGRRPIGYIENNELKIHKPNPNSNIMTFLRETILGNSHTAYFIRSKIIPRITFLAKTTEKLGLAHYDGLNRDKYDLEKQWEIVKKSIEAVNENCKKQDIIYGFFIIPLILKDSLGSLVLSDVSVSTRNFLNNFGKEHNIKKYDLYDEYLIELQKNESIEIYHEGIGHFTQYGHKITANILTNFIIKMIIEKNNNHDSTKTIEYINQL